MFKHIIYLIILYLSLNFNSYSNELKINSDRLEVDRNKKISVFIGNVHAYNQEIKIWSEKLIIKYNNDETEIEEIKAENKVKIISEEITATGEISLYYPEKDTLNIFGNVEIEENNNYVKCDELFLDIKNSTSIMRSATSKRVEALIVNN
tara:strand:- start:77 stop:526 length:450 start_codon:yes stop_codon:yes gene_type:complete